MKTILTRTLLAATALVSPIALTPAAAVEVVSGGSNQQSNDALTIQLFEQLQNLLNSNVNAINARLGGIDAEIDAIKAQLNGGIASIKADLQSQIDNIINVLLPKLRKDLQDQIDALKTRVSALEGDVSVIKGQIVAILARLDNIDALLVQINNRLTALENGGGTGGGNDPRVPGLQASMTVIFNRVAQLEALVATLQNQVNILITEVNNLKVDNTSIKNQITNLNTEINNLKIRITALENAGNGGGGDVNKLKLAVWHGPRGNFTLIQPPVCGAGGTLLSWITIPTPYSNSTVGLCKDGITTNPTTEVPTSMPTEKTVSVPLSCTVANGSCVVSFKIDDYLPAADKNKALTNVKVSVDTWYSTYVSGGCASKTVAFADRKLTIPALGNNFNGRFVADVSDMSTDMDYTASSRTVRINTYEQPRTNNCPAIANVKFSYMN